MTSIALVNDVKKETEKALLIDLTDRQVWIPKSVCDVTDDGVVMCKFWFAKKNHLGCFGLKTSVVL